MFALAALLAVPLLVQSVAADDTCTRYYTVKEGDICDSISAHNNVSTYQLATVNHGTINSNCTNLEPGCSLCLGLKGEDCNTVHVVELGDTCDDVIDWWRLNATIFYANNPQLNSGCTNLYVGEVVCTSSTVEAPALPADGTVPAQNPPATSPLAGDLPYCD